MLCPKGVDAYLQVSHPDRLVTALVRDRIAPQGSRPLSYDAAIERVAEEIRRLQEAYGARVRGVLRVLPHHRDDVPHGQVRAGRPQTPHVDYNGRLCMVSAAAANKKAFGIDRAANPWADILETQVVLVAGSNVAECSPITTNYLWQAREQGAKLVVLDPRETPIARTADLFVPLQPGRTRRSSPVSST